MIDKQGDGVIKCPQCRPGTYLHGDPTIDSWIKVTRLITVAFDVLSADNVTIEYLKFNANSNTSYSVIRAIDSDDLTVSKCYFEFTPANAMAIHFSRNDLRPVVTDCTFRDIGVGSEWGVAIRASWGSHNGYFAKNDIRRTGRVGINVNDNCLDAIIEDNTILETGGGDPSLSMEISPTCYRGVIERNTVDRWISAVSDYTAVRDNTITDPNKLTFGLELIGSYLVAARNIITGANTGISVDRNSYSLIYDNQVKDTSVMSLQGFGASVPAEHNVLLNNRFETGRYNPNVSPWSGRGVMLNRYCDYWTLDGNTIYDFDQSGFLMYETDHTFLTNNTITNCDLIGAGGEVTLGWWSARKTEILFGTGNNTVVGEIDGIPNPEPTTTNNAPTAVMNVSPTSGPAPLTVTFDGTGSSDSDGSIVRYLWDLGAGPVTTASQTSYTYKKPGTYQVRMVVWDNGGRAGWASNTITVSP